MRASFRTRWGRKSLISIIGVGLLLGIGLLITSLYSDKTAPLHYADAASGDVIVLWDGANIPAGWTCISCVSGDPFYQVFPRAATSYSNTTGGGPESLTHTLTFSTSTSESASNLTANPSLGGTFAYTPHLHTWGTPTLASSDIKPPYKNLKFIRAASPSTLPNGTIGIFDVDSASLPANWTYYTALDGNYLRGENATSTGGSATHTHTTVNGLVSGVFTGVYISAGSGVNAALTHTHTIATSTAITSDTNAPPFMTVVFAKLSATSSIPDGLIALFDAGPSGSWTQFSTSGNPIVGDLLKGGSTYGTTGGATTHNHGGSQIFTSGGPSATGVTKGGGSCLSGCTPMPTNTHTHDVTYTLSSGNSWPIYRNVILGKYHATSIANLTQTRYRWRNDNGTEVSATWAAAENTSLSSVSKQTVQRLRLEVSNEGSANASASTFRLEYATSSGASTWTAIGNPTSTSAHWVWAASTNFTDGASTTNVASGLTDDNTTFDAGQIKDAGNQTAGITLASTEFTELEYAIAATTTALDSTTYYFRVSNAGTAIDTYTTYASATTAAPPPNLTQIHYRWRNDDGVEGNGGAGSPASETELPSAAGTFSSWTHGVNETCSGAGLYSDVDDPENSPDGASTGVCASADAVQSSFNLANSAPGHTETINDVTLAINSRQTGSEKITPQLVIGGTAYSGTAYAPGATYASSATVWSTNPATAAAWTWSDIDSLEGGFISTKQGPWGGTMYVTQVYAVVDYTGTGAASATWMTNEDVSTSSIAKQTPVRLRIEVSNEGAGSATSTSAFRLEYATSSGAATWTAVGAAAGSHWQLADSSYLTDGASTTNITNGLTDSQATFDDGQVKDRGNQTAGILLNTGEFTELEYAIAATTTAINGQTYYFRVSNAGTALNTYSIYASASLASVPSGPTLAQQHSRWFADTNALDLSTSTDALAAEDTGISGVASGTIRRLRMNVSVAGQNVTAGSQFKLQFATGTGGPWTDVGGSGSTAKWRGADKVCCTDGTTLTGLRLASSTALESYEEFNSSTGTPNAVTPGDIGEWDWVLQNNGAVSSTTYYFRMVNFDGTAFVVGGGGYTNYPRLAVATTSYTAIATLISSIFDTATVNGAAFNWIKVTGPPVAGTKVRAQFATSNSTSSATFTYYGPDCTPNTYYYDSALPSTATSKEIKCYNIHNNKRYFRYKLILCSSNDCATAGVVTPEVNGVRVSWSP